MQHWKLWVGRRREVRSEMKISKLIRELQSYHAHFGDIDVLVPKGEEDIGVPLTHVWVGGPRTEMELCLTGSSVGGDWWWSWKAKGGDTCLR